MNKIVYIVGFFVFGLIMMISADMMVPEHLYTNVMIPKLTSKQWKMMGSRPHNELGVNCGSHDEEMERHKRVRDKFSQDDFLSVQKMFDGKESNDLVGPCAETICGNPKIRDQYTEIKKPIIVKIDWIFTKSNDKWKNAQETVASMMYLLKSVFKNTGIEFRARIRIYGLTQKLADRLGANSPEELINFKVHKYDCKDREDDGEGHCVEAEKLLKAVSGENWREIGALQILAVDFTRYVLNGFGKFPWSDLHGMMAIAHHALVKGATTLPHEMGHVFGLLHTFAGYDSHTCGICAESNPHGDDLKGDLISDTPPMPLYHPSVEMQNCENPANLEEYPATCTSHWKKDSNYNIMSYGTCRNSLTPQQGARMRCFIDRVIKNKFWAHEGDKTLQDYV